MSVKVFFFSHFLHFFPQNIEVPTLVRMQTEFKSKKNVLSYIIGKCIDRIGLKNRLMSLGLKFHFSATISTLSSVCALCSD